MSIRILRREANTMCIVRLAELFGDNVEGLVEALNRWLCLLDCKYLGGATDLGDMGTAKLGLMAKVDSIRGQGHVRSKIVQEQGVQLLVLRQVDMEASVKADGAAGDCIVEEIDMVGRGDDDDLLLTLGQSRHELQKVREVGVGITLPILCVGIDVFQYDEAGCQKALKDFV